MKNLEVGMEFTASDGRKGVITEIRRKWVPAPDGNGWVDGPEIECVFVRPADRKPIEGVKITGDTTVSGGLIMATAWYIHGDTLSGIWADSPVGAPNISYKLTD